jgi:phosphoenolpyruvate carboxykinase (ATP)
MVSNNQAAKTISIEAYGIRNAKVKYQLSSKELEWETIEKGQGTLANNGALAVNTGEFTGRSPKDRFIV